MLLLIFMSSIFFYFFLHSNTSYVAINHRSFYMGILSKCIQIHRMLLLIGTTLILWVYKVLEHSNTSYVAINRRDSNRKVRPMLNSNTSYVAINRFFLCLNIKVYRTIQIHRMLLLIPPKRPNSKWTSLIQIHRMLLLIIKSKSDIYIYKNKFKYIVCCY